MRITIPDLPQLAQTRTSRPTSLAVDTRGLQTLAATTEAAFQAASNAANEFWKLELQEDENVQLAAAVTKYGNGLDDASDAAAKAPPTQARTVFEAAAAEALADIRGGITNKQALLRFNTHAAGKYTTSATENRKLARTRMLEEKVFRTLRAVDEQSQIAGDIDNSVLERTEAWLEIPRMLEAAVAMGVINGKPAAEKLQEKRVQIVRDLAFGYVAKAAKPEEAAMRLEQLDPEFLSAEEKSVRAMLDQLPDETRDKLLDDLVDRAQEVADEKVAQITRENEAVDRESTEVYNSAFDPSVSLDRLITIRDVLNESWPGFDREKRNQLDKLVDQAVSGGFRFAAADDPAVILELEQLLETNSLTSEILLGKSLNLTQSKYTTYQTALRAQNDQGFNSAKLLLKSAYSYEQYKSDDSTDPVVRIAQGAYHSAIEKLLLYWSGVSRDKNEPKGSLTPAQLITKSQEIVEDNREVLRGSYLLELSIALAEAARRIPKLGNLNPADPLTDLQQRINAGTITINAPVKRLARTLNKFNQQLGGKWQ